jgi:rRNA maturation endonuclease Nob1
VAFNKTGDLDKSDVALWANNEASRVFDYEVREIREKSLRSLIKKPTEESASEVRICDKILSLMEEARKLR